MLALRFALAAGANMTYKILYNDAVAMTGGQPHEGDLTVDMIARQVRAEGRRAHRRRHRRARQVWRTIRFPPRTTFHHRDDLDLVQRQLREVKGVSVLLYDQTCAAEKRRRRKRGTFPDPDKRVIINELVCEGCGDCGVQSNCVSIQPVETEFGRKRTIDQSSCNKDFSCVNGFCPSFVTVHGARIRKAEGIAGKADPLEGVPEPKQFPLDSGWASIIDGVGGTGVVTIGAILGMAAHLEGKGCGMIDMAGLAQKGGAVFSHVRIARTPEEIHAIRVSAGKADLVLGCDLVVSGAKKVLAAVREGHTIFVANTAEIMPGDFARSCRFFVAGRTAEKGDPRGCGRGKGAFLRRHAHGHGAVRQFDRGQHVHAGLCLPAWRLAALGRGGRAGDRAERRGGGDECRGIPLGAAGCARAGIRPQPDRPVGQARRHRPRADARRGHCPARGIPDRLSERRLCEALPRPCRAIRKAETRPSRARPR